MRAKRWHWIGGTVTAFLGVALVRLVAPGLAGAAGSITLAAGFALVAAGITVIAFGTRRRDSEAFVAIEKDAEN